MVVVAPGPTKHAVGAGSTVVSTRCPVDVTGLTLFEATLIESKVGVRGDSTTLTAGSMGGSLVMTVGWTVLAVRSAIFSAGG